MELKPLLKAFTNALVKTLEERNDEMSPPLPPVSEPLPPVSEPTLEEQITDATNEFARRVTADEKDLNLPGKEAENVERANMIEDMFSDSAVLRPTVGVLKRTKTSTPNINQYFKDYFSASNIEGLSVADANYHIKSLSDELAVNYAYVKFINAKKEETTAEMSFIFKLENGEWRILSLDSNVIFEDVPQVLIEQGDVFTLWSLPAPYGTFTVKNSEESSSKKARNEEEKDCHEDARADCGNMQWKAAGYKSFRDCMKEEFRDCYNFSIGDY